MSLLPYNATALERAIEEAIKYAVEPNTLAGFKFKTTGSNINLALSWEYSLSQINIDDFKDRVIHGLQFHRLKGTPYSLKQALSWYGLTGIIIEEEGVGEKFANFQIGFDELPDVVDVDTVINVAKAAAPLRSKLFRLYNKDNDFRAFILDHSPWGDILSDYSGVRLTEDGPQLSFGRKMFALAEVGNYETNTSFENEHYNFAIIEDGFKLGCGILDETRLSEPVYPGHYYSDKVAENTDYIGSTIPDNLIQPVTACRAMIVLSDADTTLGDLQCCFAGNYEELNDEAFKLSFHQLSMLADNSRIVPIEARKLSVHTTDAVYDNNNLAAEIGLCENFAVFSAELSPEIEASCESEFFGTAIYKGNSTWGDNVHYDIPWCDQNWYGKMVEE